MNTLAIYLTALLYPHFAPVTPQFRATVEPRPLWPEPVTF